MESTHTHTKRYWLTNGLVTALNTDERLRGLRYSLHNLLGLSRSCKCGCTQNKGVRSFASVSWCVHVCFGVLTCDDVILRQRLGLLLFPLALHHAKFGTPWTQTKKHVRETEVSSSGILFLMCVCVCVCAVLNAFGSDL